MAYVYNPNISDEENEQKRLQEEQNAGSGGAGVLGGTGGAGISGVQSGGVGDTGFTNLQRYISENKSQGSDLANKVTGSLTEDANKVRGEITKAGEDFSARVGQNEIAKDDALVNRAAADPTNFVKNQQDLQSFLRQRDASYGGPRTLEETELDDNLGNRIGEAEQKVKDIDTEEGRLGLVRGAMKTQGTGKVALNQALLQGNPDAAATLQGAKTAFSGLRDYLGQVSGQAQTRAGEAETKATQARENVQNKFLGEGGVAPTFEQALAQKAAAGETQRGSFNANLADITNKLKAGIPISQLSPAQRELIRLNPGTWNLLYSQQLPGLTQTNPGAYIQPLNPYQTAATRENTASADDFAKQAALKSLLANYQGQLNPELAGQAGSFKLPTPEELPDFNNDAATRALYQNWLNLRTSTPTNSPNYPAIQAATQAIQQWLAQNGQITYDTPAPFGGGGIR